MTPLVDQICLAAGKKGAVKIHNRRISILCATERHSHKLLDFEAFDRRCDWTETVRELARRQRLRASL